MSTTSTTDTTATTSKERVLTATSSHEIWSILRSEAISIREKESFLSNFLDCTLLDAASFADSISRLLAQSFQGVISFSNWHCLLISVFGGDCGRYETEDLLEMIRCDLQAFLERDPACKTALGVYMNFKGFKSLMSHRAAHILWGLGRTEIAEAIQSRCSEIWNIDIHPGAKIGKGLMLDHGTGIVIGETCVVGENCSFLHGITLGSSGKDTGDRHPKIGDQVLIGCGAMILGNITVGKSAKIGSGSVVIKAIPENSTAVGNPARIVGKSGDTSSAASMDLALKNVVDLSGNNYNSTWSLWANGDFVFEDMDHTGKGKVNIDDMKVMMRMKFHVNPTETCMKLLFNTFDADGDGFITKTEFNSVFSQLQVLLNQQDKKQEEDAKKPHFMYMTSDEAFGSAPTKIKSKKSGGGGSADSGEVSPVYDGIAVTPTTIKDKLDANVIILEYLRKISESVEPSSFI